jgi:hypothetical protein
MGMLLPVLGLEIIARLACMKDVTSLFSEMRGALLPSAFACRPPFAFLLFPLLRPLALCHGVCNQEQKATLCQLPMPHTTPYRSGKREEGRGPSVYGAKRKLKRQVSLCRHRSWLRLLPL